MIRSGFLLSQALLLLLPISINAQSDLWLMKGHDTRRTSQSSNLGPVQIDRERSWSVDVPGGNVINVGASIDERGLYFGTWGVQRRPESEDRRLWNKFDGSLFGYRLDGSPLWGDGRADLDLVQRCYEFAGRERDGNDLFWCGLDPTLQVSFYNGTVEGQGAIDTARGVIYLGRGDGKLYAIDRMTGEIRWRFITFNPELPEDHDGGGEIVTSPIYDDERILFATWGEGPDETNAVYCINADGDLLWRFPKDSASLPHRMFASPAFDPEGKTVYFSTFIASDDRADSLEIPGVLYALDLAHNPAEGDSPLKWSMPLTYLDGPVFTNTIAVGSDGTIYVGGWSLTDDGSLPLVTAVTDLETDGEYTWQVPYRGIDDGAQYVFGIALREVNGVTERIFATTGNGGAPLQNWLVGGGIHALSPDDGSIEASYDPSDDEPTAIGGLNSPAIDREGRIYVGVRGHYRGPFAPNYVPGYYLGLDYSPTLGRFTPLWFFRTDSNYVEWSNPAIGPDGGIYAGSADNKAQDSVSGSSWRVGYTPEGTTPKFYGLKGPTLAVEDNAESSSGSILLGTIRATPDGSGVTIPIRVTGSTPLRVEIYDPLGRLLAVPFEERVEPSEKLVTWHAPAAGVYLVKVGGTVRKIMVER